jgi:hypothetical protein
VGRTTGIHWHADPSTVIEYIATDDQRQTIPWVRVTDAKNGVREYTAGTVSPDDLARGERRRWNAPTAQSSKSRDSRRRRNERSTLRSHAARSR